MKPIKDCLVTLFAVMMLLASGWTANAKSYGLVIDDEAK